VFTKPWMVDLMLDLCGYTSDKDLSRCVAVEPSCGDGAFLLPMVERLSAACHERGLDIAIAGGAIRAFDLQPHHVEACRAAVVRWLIEEGWPDRTASALAEGWVNCEDYLLDARDRDDVDLVIGNPPYIRAESIPRALRTEYVEQCTTMTEGSDIYVGFFETGLRSLKLGGVLCFICADRWMRNGYGRRLRHLVTEEFNVRAVFEMHGVDAFAEEVSAYPAVTIISKGRQGAVRYASARPTFDADAAGRLEAWADNGGMPVRDKDFAATVLGDWFHTDAHWPTGSPESLALLRDLEARYPLLEETGAKVGIGIATGADSVFVTRDPSIVEEDRLLPLVRTSDITTGRVQWHQAWLVNPWAFDGSLVPLSRYPRLSTYFEEHAAQLGNRHVAKKNEGTWYRTIDKMIPGLREQSKLLFQDMKMTVEPVLDEGTYYPHHNLYWVTSQEWDLRVLGGLLLSRVAEFFVSSYAVRMRGGILRFQAQYLRRIRVPRPSDIAPDVAEHLSRAFDARDVEGATAAALQAYGIDSIPE
jgi:adenine-specific DNA-methyltransferase